MRRPASPDRGSPAPREPASAEYLRDVGSVQAFLCQSRALPSNQRGNRLLFLPFLRARHVRQVKGPTRARERVHIQTLNGCPFKKERRAMDRAPPSSHVKAAGPAQNQRSQRSGGRPQLSCEHFSTCSGCALERRLSWGSVASHARATFAQMVRGVTVRQRRAAGRYKCDVLMATRSSSHIKAFWPAGRAFSGGRGARTRLACSGTSGGAQERRNGEARGRPVPERLARGR